MGKAPKSRPRLEFVDVVRGVIMLVMAIDHTRDYFGIPGQNPTDLTTPPPRSSLRAGSPTSAPRCSSCSPAPARTSPAGGSRRRDLSRFLFTRGLWLIFLEACCLRCLAYQFNVDYHVTLLLVLWALGWAMIALSALVRLPVSVVTAFGVVLIAGHNLFDGVRSANPLWSILHGAGLRAECPGARRVRDLSAHSLDWRDRRRLWPRTDLRLGCRPAAGLPSAPGTGPEPGVRRAPRCQPLWRPARWTHQKTALFTVLSFLNTTKYPPSLLFLLMTLGPALLFLAPSTAARRGSCGRPS